MKRLFLLLIPVLLGCTDIIDLDIKGAQTQLVVDAWLTDENREQTIKLSLSQPYFDQSDPLPAVGAEVFIIRHDSTLFRFEDKENNGNYTFTPNGKQLFELNKPAALYIKYNREEYYGVSELRRVPPIDSLKYQFFDVPVTNESGGKGGFLAQFYATDFQGEGDTYLVRSQRNGVLRNKSNDFALVYDGGFFPESQSDGMVFSFPIRASINSGFFDDGDLLTVELYSIPLNAYYFLYQLQMETNSGGIFDTPSNNVPGNIFNLNQNSSEKALGLFMISKISSFSTVIDKDLASDFE